MFLFGRTTRLVLVDLLYSIAIDIDYMSTFLLQLQVWSQSLRENSTPVSDDSKDANVSENAQIHLPETTALATRVFEEQVFILGCSLTCCFNVSNGNIS